MRENKAGSETPAGSLTGSLTRSLTRRSMEEFSRLEGVPGSSGGGDPGSVSGYASDGAGGQVLRLRRASGGRFRGAVYAAGSASGHGERRDLPSAERGGVYRLTAERGSGLSYRDLILRERDGQVFRVTGEPVFAPPGDSSGAGSGMLLPGDLLAAEAEPVLIPKEAIE